MRKFLTEDNSKHTALAKIYKNVSFPFTKQKLNDKGEKDDNGVEYWYFDSADTTLAMRTDKESGKLLFGGCRKKGLVQKM